MKKYYFQIGEKIKSKSNFGLFIYLILFLGFDLFSQNINNLDSDFKLGNYKLKSPFKIYEKNLTYKFSSPSNSDLKVYSSSVKILKISGAEKVKEISLMFYKDKLYTINIDFEGYLSDYQESLIVNDLVALIGRPTNYASNPNLKDDATYEVKKQYEWTSHDSVLLFIKSGSPYYNHSLALYSKEIQNQILKDKFN
jgi:hypothetical protein